jgi:heme exporter protein D
MIWNSWSEFFTMGGYALYVWLSFGVVAALMAGELALLAARARTSLLRAARAGSRP